MKLLVLLSLVCRKMYSKKLDNRGKMRGCMESMHQWHVTVYSPSISSSLSVPVRIGELIVLFQEFLPFQSTN